MGGAVPVVIVFLLHKKAYALRGVHIAVVVMANNRRPDAL
jgi:hypothetical protein